MEHDAEALPINLNVLAELAQKGHAYAKALHYRELEFQTNPVRKAFLKISNKLCFLKIFPLLHIVDLL